VTLAKTLNQQQAVEELPIAGISGEIVRAQFGEPLVASLYPLNSLGASKAAWIGFSNVPLIFQL
jgi:hypothetical protein